MRRSCKAIPALSIGLPVYNGEKFLSKTLDSLLGQSFREFELVISDNASTDRTSQLCREYAERDARIAYHRNDRNIGAVANYNRVFELSKAPLFKWAAADDLHCETYLETCTRLLEQSSDVVLAHSNVGFIDENGDAFPFDQETGNYVDPKTNCRQKPDTVTIGDSPVAIKRFWQVLAGARWNTHMFGIIRRPALKRTGLFANFAGGDRVMMTELALLGRFRTSPDRLFLKRFHEEVSWALNQKELRGFLSPDSAAYSRRLRQLKAYFSAPRGKPIGMLSKSLCSGMVFAHCIKIAAQSMAGKELANAAQGSVWRNKRRTDFQNDTLNVSGNALCSFGVDENNSNPAPAHKAQ